MEDVSSRRVSCYVYDTHSTEKRHRRSYIRSSPAESTIATVWWREIPKKWTENLQRATSAAAHVLKQTKKYDRGVSRILHNELHWLDVSERVQFKLCVHIYKCPHGIASKYMTDLCQSVSVSKERSCLHSAARGNLTYHVQYCRRTGQWAFSYAGSSAWNSLTNYLKGSSLILVMFKRSLKTFLFFKVIAHKVH